ncbi:MAG: transglycosylase SLT domain-containing protein [Candidatus Aenigmarchaeota archaeon]|nr:transglycosylase SLT domain-containing protein [Candidatus Aenigmarchaeota archaeon]
MKKGIGTFGLLLLGFFGTLMVGGTTFLALHGRTSVSRRAFTEMNLIDGINKVELSKIGVSKALEYSFYEAFYLTGPRGGYYTLENQDSQGCIPYWRKYTSTGGYPGFSYTGRLMLEALEDYNQEADIEVEIPSYSYFEIESLEDSEIRVQVSSNQNLELDREKLNIREDSIETTLNTNVLDMYQSGKEMFIDIDSIRNSIEGAINEIPSDSVTIDVGDICENELDPRSQLISRYPNWDEDLRARIIDNVEAIISVGDIEINVDILNPVTDVEVSFQPDCSWDEADVIEDDEIHCDCVNMYSVDCGGLDTGEIDCHSIDHCRSCYETTTYYTGCYCEEEDCYDTISECEFCQDPYSVDCGGGYTTESECDSFDHCQKCYTYTPFGEIYNGCYCEDNECSETVELCEGCVEHYDYLRDVTCTFDYSGSVRVLVTIRDTSGKLYPVLDESGNVGYQPIELKFYLVSGNRVLLDPVTDTDNCEVDIIDLPEDIPPVNPPQFGSGTIVSCSDTRLTDFIDDYNLYRETIYEAVEDEGLDDYTGGDDNAARLVAAVITQESAWNQETTCSETSGCGIMQITRSTSLGCDGGWEVIRTDVHANIRCGVRILKSKLSSMESFNEYDDDNLIKLGMAAYNGGQGTIQEAINIVGDSRWESINNIDIMTEACEEMCEEHGVFCGIEAWKAGVILRYVDETVYPYYQSWLECESERPLGTGQCYYCKDMRDEAKVWDPDFVDCGEECCPGECPPNSVYMDVPYKNQCGEFIGTTCSYNSLDACYNLCGPTSAWMMLKYYDIDSTIDDLVSNIMIGGSYCTQSSYYNIRSTLTDESGMDFSYDTGGTWETLTSEIDSGKPLIVGNGLGDQDYQFRCYSVNGHVIVIVGYSDYGDSYVIVNDPYTTVSGCPLEAGERIVYPKDGFISSWNQRSNNYIVLDV